MSRLRDRIQQHLHVLVDEVGARPPGSPANQEATTYAREVLVGCGLEVLDHPFATSWWEPGGGHLETATLTVDVVPNPYSRPGEVRGRTLHVDHPAQLEGLASVGDRVLVLAGELAREQLMPAAFPFVDLPEHDRVRMALQRLAPAAVIAVSDHWQPILEDPELALMSTTIPTDLGGRIRDGEELRLALGGAVHAGTGSTVAARNGAGVPRIVLSAHIDSKATTPGAFDNAASVATLLGAVEYLLDGAGPFEVALFNGEDHFDACGEVAWLAANDLAEVAANINLDGVGLTGRRTSLATLACPPTLERRLDGWLQRQPDWVRTEPWVESDHAIFGMQGIPAVAVTTEDVHELLGGLAHTAADTLDVVDPAILERVAHDLPGLLSEVHAGQREIAGVRER